MFLLITSLRLTLLTLMNFNTSHVSINQWSPSLLGSLHLYFNTSHVSINRVLPTLRNTTALHFNTSHVSINRCTGGHQPPAFTDFNTSHVSINHNCLMLAQWYNLISIHLMFLLIDCRTGDRRHRTHISIHLMFLLIIMAK